VATKLPDEAPLPVIDDLPSVMVPSPEPTATRAPRPLVREDEGPEEADEADEADEDEELAGIPIGAGEAEPAPEIGGAELELADVGAAEQGAPEEDGDDPPTTAQMEPAAPAEGSPSTGPNGLPKARTAQPPVSAVTESESGPEVQPRRNLSASAPPQARSTETESEPEAAADPESRRTVLVAEGPAEERRGTEPASDDEPEVDGVESGTRPRRWGLFRRRGDR
jgi:ribonuclease E